MTFPNSVHPVRRRHVFYVSGFDPNGPARYHKLYAEGARQQASFSGVSIEVGARTRAGEETMAWQVRYAEVASPGAGTVETTYMFPRWDSIVRAYWWQESWPQLRDFLQTSWQYLRTGALWKMSRQSRPAFLTVFAPFFLLVVLLPGVLAALWSCTVLAKAWRSDMPLGGPAATVVAVAALAVFWTYWARRHWHAQWILRSYAFVGRVGGEGVPAMEARLDAMAAAICRQALVGEDDEILVVGHSLGTIMAASVLARAFQRDPALARHGPAIGLVTLGHCTPMLSNLPEARRFRDELAVLAQASELCWVDYSDPIDSYSFAQVDPVAAAGLQSPRVGHPRIAWPRFDRLFEAGPHCKAAMNQHQIHQQYLCAGRPGQPYDYFAMTAGPLTLAARLGGAAGAH